MVERWDHKQFKEARLKLGLSVAECATMLGLADLAVRRYEIAPGDNNSHRTVSGPVQRLMQAYLAGWRPKDWPHRPR
jgi:hypothetical protein